MQLVVYGEHLKRDGLTQRGKQVVERQFLKQLNGVGCT